jgi:hypothetical protein
VRRWTGNGRGLASWAFLGCTWAGYGNGSGHGHGREGKSNGMRRNRAHYREYLTLGRVIMGGRISERSMSGILGGLTGSAGSKRRFGKVNMEKG